MNGAQFITPLLQFLDRMIRDHGDYLFLGFFYFCIAVIAWIVSGGLRRWFRRPPQRVHTHVIVVQCPSGQPQPVPPVIPPARRPQAPRPADDDSPPDGFAV